MLAHLAHPDSQKSRRLLWAAVLVAAVGGLSRQALAADALPVGALDAHSPGKVVGAGTSPAGTLSTQVRIEGSAAAVRGDQIDAASGKDPLVSSSNRGSVLFGAALTQSVELSLGLHGTYEHVTPARRDALSPARAAEWRRSLKETGFAGASLLAK